MRDKFVFFDNFKKTADKLPDNLRLKFYDSITDYVFKDIIPEDNMFSGMIEALKPQLDKVLNFGGAPKGNKNAVRKTTPNNQNNGCFSETTLNNINNGCLVENKQNNSCFSEQKRKEAKEKNLSNNNIYNNNIILCDNNENNTKSVSLETVFNAGYQNWNFPTEILSVAKQVWKPETIREIEIQFSCQEYATQTTIKDLLEKYPMDKEKRFVKPSIQQIQAYCKERNNRVDAEKFFNYYESQGWKVGKNPMKDWKATVRTWERQNYTQQQPKTNWSNYIGEDSFLKPDGEW